MNNNKNLTERLEQHLQNIKEFADPVVSEIEQAISKYAHKSFGNLTIALIRPTLQNGLKKFVAPNFNSIKPLLILDLRSTVRNMVEEGMSKEEAKDLLLDPAKYDDEVGNYADTSFAELYDDLCDGNRPLIKIHRFLDDLVDYLDKEIRKNYKALKGQI